MKAVLTVRPATGADALVISDIHVRSRAKAYRGQLPDRYLDDEMQAESTAFWPERMEELAAGLGVSFIAEIGDEPVGFICLERPDPKSSAFVDNLHILPAYTGRGVGGMLLDVACIWAVACDARQMHLLVLATNKAAIGFYESHGWSIAGCGNVTMGGISIGALRLELPLYR